MEVTDSDKHSSLLQLEVSYSREWLCDILLGDSFLTEGILALPENIRHV